MSLKLTVSAIALFIAAPALAADRGYVPPPQPVLQYPFVTGDLAIALGGQSTEFVGGDFTEHSGLFTGDARVSLPVAGMLNLEFELYGEGFSNFGFSTVNYSPTAHLWARLPTAALGIFGGATLGDEGFVTTGVIGAEGEVYLNNITLGLQGNYNWLSPEEDDFHYWALRGYGAWYFTPDFKGVVDVKYTGYPDFFPGADNASWTFAGTLEGHLPGLPITLFGTASYSVDRTDFFTGSDATWLKTWRGLAGVKVLLDPQGTSLLMHDRALPFTYHSSDPQGLEP